MWQVVLALSAARHECIQLQRLSLFNIDIARTMRLDDFETLQSQHIIRLLQFLRESWQPAIKKVVTESMKGVDEVLWEALPPEPSVYVDSLPEVPPDEEEEEEIFVVSRPDSRMMRMMSQINLMMSDSVREMARAALLSYVEFVGGHSCRVDIVQNPEGHPYTPLFSLELVAQGTCLGFSTIPDTFVDVSVRLLDDALAAMTEIFELDVFDMGVTSPIMLHALRSIASTEQEVLDLRKRLADGVSGSLGPLGEYLRSLEVHEALLGRDEEEFVRQLEEGQVALKVA